MPAPPGSACAGAPRCGSPGTWSKCCPGRRDRRPVRGAGRGAPQAVRDGRKRGIASRRARTRRGASRPTGGTRAYCGGGGSPVKQLEYLEPNSGKCYHCWPILQGTIIVWSDDMTATHCQVCGKPFLAHVIPNTDPPMKRGMISKDSQVFLNDVCSAECLIALRLATIAKRTGG